MKIILTRGLPASGKSTWAKELITKEPGKWKRINKDDLRAMLDDGKWSKGNEQFIINARNVLIRAAMTAGHNVIIDDTNLHDKHTTAIQEIIDACNEIEKKNGTNKRYELEIKDFTDVPLDECIKRDQRRSNYVGEKVIKQMYKQFLAQKPKKQDLIDGLPNAVICDLDGTLALFGDANPYDRDFLADKVNMPIYEILHREKSDRTIIFVSGRKNKFQVQTETWLKRNGLYIFDFLYMPRAEDDTRKDVLIKQEIYQQHIKGKYNVVFVLDDRDQVVEFWRSEGLTCLQVNYGDF